MLKAQAATKLAEADAASKKAAVARQAAANRWPGTSRGRGALAGLAIYAGSHGSALPALGIQRPPWRLAPAAVAWELTSHLVFGAALITVVLASAGEKQYPAVWFHRWHGLKFAAGQATLLVSRGLGDTFPFRFNCPREVLLCRLA